MCQAGQYLLSKADDSTVPMVPGVPAPAKTKDGLGAESGKVLPSLASKFISRTPPYLRSARLS